MRSMRIARLPVAEVGAITESTVLPSKPCESDVIGDLPLFSGYSLAAWMVIVFLAFPAFVFAQRNHATEQSTDQQADQEQLRAFMSKSPNELLRGYFRNPPYPIFAIRRLIDIGDPTVIPCLEEAYARQSQEPAKEFLAAALVDLGARKPEYFDYVADRAKIAVASDLPFPVRLDARIQRGATLPPLKPSFTHWVREHDANLDSALWQAAFDMPADVEALGEANDRESRPILLQGLKSPNILIVFAASLGLARLQDNSSVPLIIVAARREPRMERRMIAKALLYFPITEAQRAAERLTGDPVLLRRWRAEVKKRGFKMAMRDRGQ